MPLRDLKTYNIVFTVKLWFIYWIFFSHLSRFNPTKLEAKRRHKVAKKGRRERDV